MNCAEARRLLEARRDGEPSGEFAAPLQAHLEGCAACRAAESLRDLRGELRAARSRPAAPADAQRDVPAPPGAHERGVLPFPPRVRARPRRRGVVLGAAAGAVVAELAAWPFLRALERRRRMGAATLLVDAHVRAGLSSRRVEIASSDPRTVKPWLSSRLDYSPPVPATLPAGVTLAGARIESLDGRRTAVLVYRAGEYWIDAFVRPGRDLAAGATTVRGFHVVPAEGRGMTWQVVSDTGLNVLEPLARQLAGAGAAPE